MISASEIVGSAICRRRSTRPPSPPELITGNHRSLMAKIINRMMEATKAGSDRPTSETSRNTKSAGRLRLTAAHTPAGTPSRTPSASAATVSSSV